MLNEKVVKVRGMPEAPRQTFLLQPLRSPLRTNSDSNHNLLWVMTTRANICGTLSLHRLYTALYNNPWKRLLLLIPSVLVQSTSTPARKLQGCFWTLSDPKVQLPNSVPSIFTGTPEKQWPYVFLPYFPLRKCLSSSHFKENCFCMNLCDLHRI